jgi:hypothetical protein
MRKFVSFFAGIRLCWLGTCSATDCGGRADSGYSSQRMPAAALVHKLAVPKRVVDVISQSKRKNAGRAVREITEVLGPIPRVQTIRINEICRAVENVRVEVCLAAGESDGVLRNEAT